MFTLRYVFALIFCSAFLLSVRAERSDSMLVLVKKEFSTLYSQGVLPKNVKPDSLFFSSGNDTVYLRLNSSFGELVVREELTAKIADYASSVLKSNGVTLPVVLLCGTAKVEELIPNLYRNKTNRDAARIVSPGNNQFVTPVDESRVYKAGLSGHNMILWQSHGWYYSNGSKRWEWQRPRLFETVEDLVPMSYILPFLTPMLENSGAYVFMPRERDIQTEEFVVDNDKNSQGIYTETPKGGKTWKKTEAPGFLFPVKPLEEKQNPFLMGSARYTAADKKGTAGVQWKAKIKKAGMYSVSVAYVSTPQSVSDAVYTVHYSGGDASFKVNQKVGGGTWIYLGTFYFSAGAQASVTLTGKSSEKGIITADAVRFGGGMGNVARGGAVSGRARYLEGARYWLQYAGMPDTLVYDLNKGENDYKDDYQCRAEYGNYISGAPGGPNRERTNKGLGIPLSLSIAFHTDAGITQNDTVIGSLAIYSSSGTKGDKDFPSGGSRMTSRDLSDIVQTQLVSDIRKTFDKSWTRRQLKDADYSEATRPNVPALLLEAFSHQNFADMRLHHDPLFRFTLARAIYKGIVKFLKQDSTAQVQPLPVTSLSAEVKNETAIIKWKPVADTLEKNANASMYRVYTRTGSNGFDRGVLVKDNSYTANSLKKGEVYSFCVTALNDAGESFPSEIICAVNAGPKAKKALIINGFTRVSAPEHIATQGFKGFLSFLDEGVAWGKQFNVTGRQYDFNPLSPYRSNDESGNGASGAETETEIVAGNTFDNTVLHARAFAAAGYSVSSCSEAAFTELRTGEYDVTDLFYGEQKSTRRINQKDTTVSYSLFAPKVREQLAQYLSTGGRLIISGSYIASDCVTGYAPDSLAKNFLKKTLKVQFNSRYASATGKVVQAEKQTSLPVVMFRIKGTEDYYGAEAAGSLLPAGNGTVLLRYAENLTPAAVGFSGKGGVVAFGFPLETVTDSRSLHSVVEASLKYLFEKNEK